MANGMLICISCNRAVTLENYPWRAVCLHNVCNECAQQPVVHCNSDDMDTRSTELVINQELIEGLRQTAIVAVVEAGPCQHQLEGMYPCCTLCGELLEQLSDLQDWTCEHCLSTNSGLRFICTFCCKANQDQREKLKKESERMSQNGN